MSLLCLLLSALLASQLRLVQAAPERIIARPIPFGPQRQALTLDYIRQHYDPQATDISITPQMIVLHWSATASLAATLATFTPARLPPGRPALHRAGVLNVSAHFVVDRDGTLYQLMPTTWMARHIIGLNRLALGIENVGGPQAPLTAAQVEANAWLIRHLVTRHPTIKYLIGHHEYGRLRHTRLWQERDASYFSGKPDPGEAFMRAVRAAVHAMGLQLSGPDGAQ
ncbi:MAG: N-acetylmuramoyl-L-alanine amidase [Candidatus Tectimicrobiota bacterium]